MTSPQQGHSADSASRIIESVREATDPALEAVRRFINTVDGAFPDFSEDGPRRKIIDSAFEMTEQLVGISTQFAEMIVRATSTEGEAGAGWPKS